MYRLVMGECLITYHQNVQIGDGRMSHNVPSKCTDWGWANVSTDHQNVQIGDGRMSLQTIKMFRLVMGLITYHQNVQIGDGRMSHNVPSKCTDW